MVAGIENFIRILSLEEPVFGGVEVVVDRSEVLWARVVVVIFIDHCQCANSRAIIKNSVYDHTVLRILHRPRTAPFVLYYEVRKNLVSSLGGYTKDWTLRMAWENLPCSGI